MTVQDDKNKTSSPVAETNRPASMSRRAVLRGGITAMPAILTLQSGAALARSSNLISAAPPGTRDRLGRTLCLDTNSVYPATDSRHVFDLGEPPRADVNIITERDYRVFRSDPGSGQRHDYDDHDQDDKGGYSARNTHRRRGEKIDESVMCEGGRYWYNDRDGSGWQSVELPHRGIVVSSGAMTSIADHVVDTLI